MTRRPAVEWPTVIVAVAAHGLWLAALAIHRHVPAVVTVAALAIAIAWHSSLQHEVIHGHPFRRRALNDCLASLPLSIAVPYALYRHLHLAHHAAARLTDPIEDSESFYIGASDWARLPRTCRALLVVNQTLLGRIVFGPAISLWRFFRSQFDAVVRRGHRTLARWWLAHLALVAGLAVFVVGVCRVSPWQYALGVYLAHSLVLVRSFSEHYYTDGGASRSAIVPAGRFFSLLYLNNNLHHTHHARPGLAWYQLPAATASLAPGGGAVLGARRYDGYLDIARRYLVRPIDHPLHPDHRDRAPSAMP